MATPISAKVLAQSCHALIGEFWCEAMDVGFLKPRRDGTEKALWVFMDRLIPLPNKHTAAFWVYACESGIDLNPTQKEFQFVPPLSTPIQLENLTDAGVDAFVHPALPPLHDSMQRHVGGETRKDMGKMIQHLGTYTPVATWEAQQVSIALRYDPGFGVPESLDFDALWRRRLALGEFIGTPIRLPNCHRRLTGAAGKHLESLTYHGLSVRGDFDGVGQEWASGSPVKVTETHSLTTIPAMTMPLWLGFRFKDGRPTQALFDWCRAYAKHRAYGVACLMNPDTFVGYPDFTIRLRQAGRIANAPKQNASERGYDSLVQALNGLDLNQLL